MITAQCIVLVALIIISTVEDFSSAMKHGKTIVVNFFTPIRFFYLLFTIGGWTFLRLPDFFGPGMWAYVVHNLMILLVMFWACGKGGKLEHKPTWYSAFFATVITIFLMIKARLFNCFLILLGF